MSVPGSGRTSVSGFFRNPLEQLQNFFCRASDNRPIADHKDRALHQHRVFEQNFDHRIRCLVVGCLESEFLEILVLSDQFDRPNRKQAYDPPECAAVGRLLDVFDDVELDVALAQDFQRAARLASARVVVQQRGRHALPPSRLRAEHSKPGVG